MHKPLLITSNKVLLSNEYKDTPLILATKEGQVNVVKTLIKLGSNLELRGEYNKTAYEHLFHYICTHAPRKKTNNTDTNIPDSDTAALVSLYGSSVLSHIQNKVSQKTISKKEIPVYMEVLNQLAAGMPRAKSEQNISNTYLFSKNAHTK